MLSGKSRGRSGGDGLLIYPHEPAVRSEANSSIRIGVVGRFVPRGRPRSGGALSRTPDVGHWTLSAPVSESTFGCQRVVRLVLHPQKSRHGDQCHPISSAIAGISKAETKPSDKSGVRMIFARYRIRHLFGSQPQHCAFCGDRLTPMSEGQPIGREALPGAPLFTGAVAAQRQSGGN